ncbi:hypothetical protein [Kitasatospora sp. NPDC001175]|uniref:hypothetical protein n=1 Tax=Kitasatospora sp. NPDC001175 TaxID=3157103 RepID=UPI003CFCCBAD
MTAKPSAYTEYTDCPTCGKAVAVYNPRGGDGSIRITHWHKRQDEEGRGRWCRAEVDYGRPPYSDLRRTRHATTAQED